MSLYEIWEQSQKRELDNVHHLIKFTTYPSKSNRVHKISQRRQRVVTENADIWRKQLGMG